MKLVELFIFLLLVLFIGSMTLSNREKIIAKKVEVMERKEKLKKWKLSKEKLF